jgi:signal transduction histidine kinase
VTTSVQTQIASVEATHKEFANRLVLPAMGAVSLVFHVLLFRAEPAVFAILAVIVPFLAFNAWVSKRPRTLRLGRHQVNLRTDAADAVRWLVNLVALDVPLFLIYRPPMSIALTGWTVLLLAAQADLFRSQFRNRVVGIGFAAGLFVFWRLALGAELGERLWAPVAMGSILFVFDRMERYWVTELVERKQKELEAVAERLRAESLERDALIGHQAKTISHELANLITIIDFATADERAIQFERVRRSLKHIHRINGLVLNDLRRAPQIRVTTLGSIFEDVRILIQKEILVSGVQLQVALPADAAESSIRERTGSSFLILRNLIKNATEAARAHAGAAGGARVMVDVTAGAERIQYVVSDNGAGMTREQIEALLDRRAVTTKADGNGLGFRFVLDECERNCFEIGVSSEPGAGTKVTVSMPIAGAPAAAA